MILTPKFLYFFPPVNNLISEFLNKKQKHSFILSSRYYPKYCMSTDSVNITTWDRLYHYPHCADEEF